MAALRKWIDLFIRAKWAKTQLPRSEKFIILWVNSVGNALVPG